MKICPLGLFTFEDVCPHAPCVACMRRLGEHIKYEIAAIGRQADVAYLKGDVASHAELSAILARMSAGLDRQPEPPLEKPRASPLPVPTH